MNKIVNIGLLFEKDDLLLLLFFIDMFYYFSCVG